MKAKTLEGLLSDYCKFKRSCGVVFYGGEYWLKRYVKFHLSEYSDCLLPTRNSVQAFEETIHDKKDKSGIIYLKGFCRYLRSLGYEVYVSKTKECSADPELPYIITADEGNTFFDVLNQMEFPHSSMWRGKSLVLSAFYRMMWSCGTRTKETRTLLCKNVNLDQGYIDIINSKGNKDRRIYLSEEFRSYLSAYDNKMKLLRPNRSYFFSGGKDFSPISERKITENFKVIWYTAFPDFDRSIRIRLYDFRHHFVYENINRWLREGKNVNVMMYYLMQVTGHKTTKELLYYFHLVPEIYQTIKNLTADLNDLFPENYYIDDED